MYNDLYKKLNTYADQIMAYVTDTSPEVTETKRKEIKAIMGARGSETKQSMQNVVDASIDEYEPSTKTTIKSPQDYEAIANWFTDTKRIHSASKGVSAGAGKPISYEGNEDAIARSVKDIESSGDYTIRGPVVKKGMYKGQRALGAYQVMPGNLSSWSKAAIGREVSQREFLENPEMQDKVFLYQIRLNAEKYGSVDDAVSVWFTGMPIAKAGNVSDGYTTVSTYIDKFRNNFAKYTTT